MALESVGPGGVSNSYGVRVSTQPVNINSAKPKDVYNEYGTDAGVLIDSSGNLVNPQDDSIIAVSEVTAYVTRTTTGTAHTGAGEFAGYICTVAAGNITIYDNTSAAGTVIVPTTALVVGAFPIFGAGTNGKLALTTGCHVVLSGAATVNVLVQ
jgi:hypothetical protein